MAFSYLAARFVGAALALAAFGCASTRSVAVPQPRVVLVQDDEFVLTGTIDEKPPQATGCVPAGSPKHIIKLIEPLKAKMTLRGTNGAAPLVGAVMSVTNVESRKTICAEMKDDGRPAILPAEFPSGTYEIAVAGNEPRRYEILWEQR